MIDIPPCIQIKSTIKSGSVYYFTESSFSSPEPHYFIVLNHDPLSDRILVLVCASSRIETVKRRRRNCPCSTLVEISQSQYSGFTKHTIIDCNDVMEYTIDDLINKIEKGELKLKPEIDTSLVAALRSAVYDSTLVSNKIKKLLQFK